MATTPSRSLEQPRPDIAQGLDEFNLRANQAGFVGLRIFPVIEVATAFGRFRRLKIKDLLKRRKSTKRAAKQPGKDGRAVPSQHT